MARPNFVTVVLPVRNGGAHIERQLRALAGQTYEGAWELLVVDNGSSDASVELALATERAGRRAALVDDPDRSRAQLAESTAS